LLHIASLKKGLGLVTDITEANSEFMTKAKDNLPNVMINLEKLSIHYRANMPKINKVLFLSKAHLKKLEENRWMIS
jgi:hypothetical protein